MMMMNFNFKTICKFAVVSLTVLESPLGSVNATDNNMHVEADVPAVVNAPDIEADVPSVGNAPGDAVAPAVAAVIPALIAPEDFVYVTPPQPTRRIRQCPPAPKKSLFCLFVVIVVIIVVVVFFSNFV